MSIAKIILSSAVNHGDVKVMSESKKECSECLFDYEIFFFPDGSMLIIYDDGECQAKVNDKNLGCVLEYKKTFSI